MSGGYRVVLSDLSNASSVFARDGDAFASIMPAMGPSCPDTGEASLNQVLGAALQMTGMLHDAIATSIRRHSANLASAHHEYLSRDAAIEAMCRELTDQGDQSY